MLVGVASQVVPGLVAVAYLDRRTAVRARNVHEVDDRSGDVSFYRVESPELEGASAAFVLGLSREPRRRISRPTWCPRDWRLLFGELL